MNSYRTPGDQIFLVIKGLAMGAANKVPGVSGGIVAFVAGFYEEFIYSLQKVNLKAFKLLINGRFRSFYRYINGKFLGLLIFGMLVSYFSVSRILDYFIARKELYVWAAFFGMIIGSIYYISRGFSWNRKTVVSAVIGLIAGISISFLSPARENTNLFFVFLCGIISVSGMTLPGFRLFYTHPAGKLRTVARRFGQCAVRYHGRNIPGRFLLPAKPGTAEHSYDTRRIHPRIGDRTCNPLPFTELRSQTFQKYNYGYYHRFYYGIARGRLALEKNDVQDARKRQLYPGQ